MSTNWIRISIFGRKYSNIRIYSNIRFNTDEDYDYDDPDLQITVNLGDGVFKQYLNEDTYYLRFKGGRQDNRSQNSNDYSDVEDYYKDDYYKDNGSQDSS